MKQVLQNLRSGATVIADVPCPAPRRGHLLVCSRRTLVSAGTERMLIEFGKAGWIEKARQHPARVRRVLDKIKTDGLVPAVEAIADKLDRPLALGNCNVGIVLAVGDDVSGFAVGDRVVSNGKHAEVVCVPKNLCAKVPGAVCDDEAAFTVIAAIALQGVRLVQPSLGETIVVTGLGLIGLIAIQLLRANGCRVLGIDYAPARLALARRFGAEVVDLAAVQDPTAVAQVFSRGRGVDAVLVTAATQSNEPMHQAAMMSRQRGRIVLVGEVGLELARDDFFKKELTFQVSSSYGPGRYDSAYEEKGQDYPVGFVRWTAQRNFEAVLDMIAERRLELAPLVSHRFAIQDAVQAYDLMLGDAPPLGLLLEYPAAVTEPRGRIVQLAESPAARLTPVSDGAPSVSFIGSGNYASAVLIPAFKDAGSPLRIVASNDGVTGFHAGHKFGFAQTTTDPQTIFVDRGTNAVVIATHHDSHARFVLRALAAGKHVFVEKPLCLTLEELNEIETLHTSLMTAGSAPKVMVGFNRRFAPQVQQINRLLAHVPGAKAFVLTVNAGAILADHWTQDPDAGGGRILGEGCHFIDLLRFLVGHPITGYQVTPMVGTTADTASIQLVFADGSIGTVHYFANGSRSFPKERLEVFAAGGVLQLDNYRKLTGFGWKGFRSLNLWRQDKGQKACVAAFVQSLAPAALAPIPFAELIEVSRIAIQVAKASKTA